MTHSCKTESRTIYTPSKEVKGLKAWKTSDANPRASARKAHERDYRYLDSRLHSNSTVVFFDRSQGRRLIGKLP
jgi:hypothetical protein